MEDKLYYLDRFDVIAVSYFFSTMSLFVRRCSQTYQLKRVMTLRMLQVLCLKDYVPEGYYVPGGYVFGCLKFYFRYCEVIKFPLCYFLLFPRYALDSFLDFLMFLNG